MSQGIPLTSKGRVNCRKTSAKNVHTHRTPIGEKYMYKEICPEIRDNQEFLGALDRPTHRPRPWQGAARIHPETMTCREILDFWYKKLFTAGKPCTTVVDLKHGLYKVVLMLPPLTKRVRTYIDGCQIGTCFYNCDLRSNRRSHAVAFKPLTLLTTFVS